MVVLNHFVKLTPKWCIEGAISLLKVNYLIGPKFRRIKLPKIGLATEYFVGRKVLSVENFVRRNIVIAENF